MDPRLAVKKKAISSLILVVGLFVIGVGAFVLNKTGINFLFGEKAASGAFVTLTGILKKTADSKCYNILPSEYKSTPYVLEGSFPILNSGDTRQKEKITSLISTVIAAPAPPRYPTSSTVPSTRPTKGPRPTPANYDFSTTCRPIYATSDMVGNLLAQKVVVTGVQNGVVLYAKSIKSTTVSSCKEQCPGTDGVLRNCTPPEADGTAQESLCNSVGRVESCGGAQYCCPTLGGAWTKDLTKCSPPATLIPNPVSIKVVSPNGGESLYRYQTYNIAWQASPGVANYLVYAVNVNGGISLIGSANSPQTSITWNANPPNFVKDPNTFPNQYKIRVVNSQQTSMFDESDNFFTINPAPIALPTSASN